MLSYLAAAACRMAHDATTCVWRVAASALVTLELQGPDWRGRVGLNGFDGFEWVAGRRRKRTPLTAA